MYLQKEKVQTHLQNHKTKNSNKSTTLHQSKEIKQRDQLRKPTWTTFAQLCSDHLWESPYKPRGSQPLWPIQKARRKQNHERKGNIFKPPKEEVEEEEEEAERQRTNRRALERGRKRREKRTSMASKWIAPSHISSAVTVCNTFDDGNCSLPLKTRNFSVCC